MARYRLAEIAESEQWLHELLDDHHGEVLLILRSVARSGMSRRITPIVTTPNNDTRYLGFNVSRMMGLPWSADDASVKVDGGGMDMGLHLISGVSQRLYGDPNRLRHRWL